MKTKTKTKPLTEVATIFIVVMTIIGIMSTIIYVTSLVEYFVKPNISNQDLSNSALCQSVGLQYQNGTDKCYLIEGKAVSYYKIEKINDEYYVNKLTEVPIKK